MIERKNGAESDGAMPPGHDAIAGRRALLQGATLLALLGSRNAFPAAEPATGSRSNATGSTPASAAVVAAAVGVGVAPPVDSADPSVQLRTFMRLFSSEAGECAVAYQGTLYGRIPGKLPQPLIAFRTIVQIRAEQIERDVYRTEQREAYHYADLATGAIASTFTNPYTGENVIPIGYVSPNNIYYFDTTGSYARARPAERPGKLTLDWRHDDSELWVTESRYNEFPTSITEAEFPRAYAGPSRSSVDILTYRASLSDIGERQPASVPARLTMVSETPWPLWMMMGKRPGDIMLQGFGRKYRSIADIPAWFAAATESVYPGFMADPWRFSETQFGTAAQLKRLRAAGKL